MAQVQNDNKAAPTRLENLRAYLRQRPVMLGILAALAVIFFLLVTALSSAFQAQRVALGNRWFNRGVADLNAKRYAEAVTEFRAALIYSRDDFNYQLNLAEALIGVNQIPQASAYLLNLWDREPENGQVNVELARIEAARGETQQAIRYYHNAVYAAWPNGQDAKRQETRLELIDLLLHINAKAQAQAELIALAENVGDDPAEQQRLGELLIRAGDYDHALAAYRVALRADRHNAAALAGAGESAFKLERYSLAEYYLRAAVAANPRDSNSAARLKTAEMVLKMDPYRPHISTAERNQLVMDAFATAGQRLTSCAVPKGTSAAGQAKPGLSDEWTALKPRITRTRLERNPELVDAAMDLVFSIEKQTNTLCGTPTEKDLALLLIARLHEGS